MNAVDMRFVHLLASAVLLGGGLFSTFYLITAGFSGNARFVADMARCVVRAGWVLMLPAVVIQGATGARLIYLAGVPLSTPWVRWSVLLFLIAVASGSAMGWLQGRLRDLAIRAAGRGLLPAAPFGSYFALWVASAALALGAAVAMVGSMNRLV